MERSNGRELREMSPLQTEVARGDSAARGPRRFEAAPRLLEDASSGLWLLLKLKRPIARAVGVEQQDVSFRYHSEPHGIEATVFKIEKLYWDHSHALLQLEGAAPAQLIGPNYLVLQARKGHVTDTRPHLRDVVLVLVHKVPEGLQLLDLFGELRRRLV